MQVCLKDTCNEELFPHWTCEDFSPICSCSCHHTASAAGGMKVCPGLPATREKSPGPAGPTGPGQVPERGGMQWAAKVHCAGLGMLNSRDYGLTAM